MKKSFLICFLFFAATIYAQHTGSIQGKILDAEMNSEPLLFANVHIKNSNTKVETNFHGNFEINNIETGKHTLVVSYAGYETIEIPVVIKNNNTLKINQELKAKTISLEDFILVDEINTGTASIEKKQTK